MRITLDDLSPDLPAATKWQMLYHHFQAGGVVGPDILAAIAWHYRQCKKDEAGLPAIGPETTDQLTVDLATFRRYCRPGADLRQFVKSDGSANISAVCRAIGVEPGGAGWRRGVAVVEELQRQAKKRRSSTSTGRRRWQMSKMAA